MRKGALEMLVTIIIIIIIVSVQSLFKGGTKEKTGNDERTDFSYFSFSVYSLKKSFPFFYQCCFTLHRQLVGNLLVNMFWIVKCFGE